MNDSCIFSRSAWRNGVCIKKALKQTSHVDVLLKRRPWTGRKIEVLAILRDGL